MSYPLKMLELFFPFTVDNKEIQLSLDAVVQRKDNFISFALTYKFSINIPNSKCVSVQKSDGMYVYVYEFDDINDAMKFETKQVCFVQNSTVYDDSKMLEEEIVKYAQQYINKEGNRKRHKKQMTEDEDGFIRYV